VLHAAPDLPARLAMKPLRRALGVVLSPVSAGANCKRSHRAFEYVGRVKSTWSTSRHEVVVHDPLGQELCLVRENPVRIARDR